MKDEVKTSSSIQQITNHLHSNSARGARVQRVDPPFWPRLGRFRFGCPGVGIAQQPPGGTGESGRREGRKRGGGMELWIAAYGSCKRVMVAKTDLVRGWRLDSPATWQNHKVNQSVASKVVVMVVMGTSQVGRYGNKLGGWTACGQLTRSGLESKSRTGKSCSKVSVLPI
ncbi:hypothetical protein BO94DRAFT_559956 [Aspergillus sclerotioniger CBS 115572]|uniref:Uncharacterized protein n=1 Tax=Aspergillus sclerotioniger CBS 115572 TaxID=1450535 RepID=A0A317VMM2_9EURO|nr:hypothetical protein BO94DRAFT_559956 [Aspergillus sclerotioniger CBS 115572]PWY73170.1 hypothetical protein BO94DRAFT_559956 [Aspergillus sclerotioniger CBS 115572]